jgi:hypothetical protein
MQYALRAQHQHFEEIRALAASSIETETELAASSARSARCSQGAVTGRGVPRCTGSVPSRSRWQSLFPELEAIELLDPSAWDHRCLEK